MNLFSHLLILLFTAQFLAAQPVAFIRNGKLAEVMTRAKETGKLVFVDVYTDWCGPCKMMDQLVFTDPEIAGRLNAFFLPLKANAEQGAGHAIKRQFQIESYPTLLFLNPYDSSTLFRLPGAVDKRSFLYVLNQIIYSTRDGEVFIACDSAWNAGHSSVEITDTYFQLRTRYQLSNDSLLEEYLHRLPADSLENPAVKKIFVRHTTAMQGDAFEYLRSHNAESSCAWALKRIIDAQLKNAIAQKDEDLLTRALNAAAGAEPDPEWAPHRQAQMRMEYYLSVGRPERFHAVAKDYVPNRLLPALSSARDSARQQQLVKTLENITWQYAEFVKKKNQLAEALEWLNRCPVEIWSDDSRRYLQVIARKAE